jgi:hypothetical protein
MAEWKKDRIPCHIIAEAVLDWKNKTDSSYYDLYTLLGWEGRNEDIASYMTRILGISRNTQSRKSMSIERAAEIIRAIGRDPWEFDI